jgi:hypothetical protein
MHEHPGESRAHHAERAPGPTWANPAASLTALLSAAPVDLCRVSAQMRTHPDLQALVVRLAGYLSFSPDTSGISIEESVVVLGTDRLRVLVYLWSLLWQQRHENKRRDPVRSRTSSPKSPKSLPGGRAVLHAEMVRLSNFLESLALDGNPAPPPQAPTVPQPAQESEFYELTNMLIRDIVSLIPLSEPGFRKRR